MKRKTQIIAFGFDKIVTNTDGLNHTDDEYTIGHVAYDSEESIASADAIMLPSDIFEITKTHQDVYGHRYTTYQCETKKLAEREKQLYRVLDRNGWVCLFLRRLNPGGSRETRFNDLARKLVNKSFDWANSHDPFPHLRSKSDEFRAFIDDFGIAQTKLGVPFRAHGIQALATSDDVREVFAAEIGGRKFFLPLKPISRQGELADILKCAAKSILSYKKRNDLYLPQWLEAICFKNEENISSEIDALSARLDQAKLELSKWPRYKAVLTASGTLLNKVVVSVLRDFFQLNLKSEEGYIEDALIHTETGTPLFVVEIKGVNSGIKREQINQLDSHRERLGMDQHLPGLLIINDFAETPGIEARKAKRIDGQHLEHARRLNVRILRTVTLIEIMLATESRANRSELFLKACDQGSPIVALPPLA